MSPTTALVGWRGWPSPLNLLHVAGIRLPPAYDCGTSRPPLWWYLEMLKVSRLANLSSDRSPWDAAATLFGGRTPTEEWPTS